MHLEDLKSLGFSHQKSGSTTELTAAMATYIGASVSEGVTNTLLTSVLSAQHMTGDQNIRGASTTIKRLKAISAIKSEDDVLFQTTTIDDRGVIIYSPEPGRTLVVLGYSPEVRRILCMGIGPAKHAGYASETVPFASVKELIENLDGTQKRALAGGVIPDALQERCKEVCDYMSNMYKGWRPRTYEMDAKEVRNLYKNNLLVTELMFKSAFREKIKGGKGSGKKPSDFDKKQLEMGVSEEKEHTTDKSLALEITMDHLAEDPKYYTKLKKVMKKGINPSNEEQLDMGEIQMRQLDEALKNCKLKKTKKAINMRISVVTVQAGAPGKYSHINFKPPKSVVNAAKKGLEFRRKSTTKGGLSSQQARKHGVGSGVSRASTLSNGKNVSPQTVKRMAAFFSRHAKNRKIDPKYKSEPWNDRGYVAWLLWGGDAGRSWSAKVSRQMAAADGKHKKANSDAELDDSCWDGYEAIGLKTKDGKKVPNCVPVKSAVAGDIKTVHVKVEKGLSAKDGREAVWKAAKRKGKNDARGITYDPKTGKGTCT